MKFTIIAAATLAASTGAAVADGHAGSGDADAGEKAFKQCQSCHVVQNDAGDVLAGRNAKTGPNLFGLMGEPAGSVEGFRYSKGMIAAAEAGLVWDEANLLGYLQDPTKFLRAYLDDSGVRSNMAFRLRKEEDAANLYTFLATVGE